MTAETHQPVPRYERFTVTYPSGTVIESYYLIEGGGTLRQVQVEHPMATVEPVSDSRMSVEAKS
jgi:hypothetical protein